MKKGSLLVLFLAVFIDLLGFGIVVPLLSFYAQTYGASGFVLGGILASYSLMQFFFSPIWGRLSDRVGRRPVLIGALSGNVAGYLIFAFSQSIALLMLARIVSGMCAANIATAQAYVADSTTPENRSKGMGLIGAAFGLGFIFGPPAGGILAHVGQEHGMHGNFLPGLFAASLSLAAVLIATFSLPESKSPDTTPRRKRPPQFDAEVWRMIFRDRRLALGIAALALLVLSFSALEPTVVLHGRARFGFSPKELGYFFGFMGIIVAGVQGGVIGRITRRFGDAGTALIGGISAFLGLAIIPSIYTVPFLFAVAFFLAIGQAFCYPAVNAHITKVSPADQRGSVLGLSAAMGSLSRVIGPLMAGVLFDRWQSAGAFYGQAICVALGVALTIALVRLMKNEPAVAAEVEPDYSTSV
ncbi:MAG: MFS transporter [Acidobacteria bacterium]|nr:MFS transporter [Acidobacteriota bacterium]